MPLVQRLQLRESFIWEATLLPEQGFYSYKEMKLVFIHAMALQNS